MRGERALRALESPLLRLDRVVERAIAPALNPFAQTGAIANTSFIVAIVSGIVLLFWYVPSVTHAFESLEAVRVQPLGGQLVRSVHRYSSDACVFFVALHALRDFFGRRFTGARWLAWVTGFALVGMLWFVGWLGYWLVWDERAQAIAVGSSKLVDVLPVIAIPFSRAFLTDETVSSFFFFVVFFVHMLLPLAMAIALWLHIKRLSRPHFLTGRVMTAWVLASLVAISLAWPATSAGPARMAVPPEAYTFDAWYLLPLALTDRLGGGALWAIVLVAGAVIFSVPWSLSRRAPPPAEVDPEKCTACQRCYVDCPYGAITMVPRTDGKRYETEAWIDPSKCVGCGICAGSCDSAAIGPPWITATDARHRIDGWIDEACRSESAPMLALVCAESAGAGFRAHPETGVCERLPGYRVFPIPCAGWVHALTVERALRHGAAGVLVVGCGPSECNFREGGTWTIERLAGRREPALRLDKVDASRVRFVELTRTSSEELVRVADDFRRGKPRAARARRRTTAAAAGILVATGIGAATVVASDLPYRSPTATSELVVSFVHPGRAGNGCRQVTEEEKAALPVHMRRDVICERGRAEVRLRVRIDGRVALTRSHEPGGLFGDSVSAAIDRVPVPPGEHRIVLEIGETPDPNEWTHRDERTLTFEDRARRVVLFDRSDGFRWR